RVTEVPQLIDEMRDLLADFIPDLITLQVKANAIRAKHRAIHDQYGDVTMNGLSVVKGLKTMEQREVLSLCGTHATPVAALIGEDNILPAWLKRANRIG